MRRSISLEDLGLATDAPSSPVALRESAQLEGKEAMRGAEAVRIAALEDEASPEGPRVVRARAACERVGNRWLRPLDSASEDRQVSADSTRALSRLRPNLRIRRRRARSARRSTQGLMREGRLADATRAPRHVPQLASSTRACGPCARPHPARISRRPRLAPQSQQEWRRRSVFPPRHT